MTSELKFLWWCAMVITCGASFRMWLAIVTHAWFHALYKRVEMIVPFDCAEFHTVMATPRPWYVRLNEYLEREGL